VVPQKQAFSGFLHDGDSSISSPQGDNFFHTRPCNRAFTRINGPSYEKKAGFFMAYGLHRKPSVQYLRKTNRFREVCCMSMVQGENTGLRDPYRTLLILFWGALMALAALAGQIGGQDDFKVSGVSAPTESHARMESEQKSSYRPSF
jgi:hypothetical protein